MFTVLRMLNDANTRSILCSFGHELSQLQLTQWTEKTNAPVTVRGEIFGGNKLRTYRTFKNEFITEPYLSIIHLIVHRNIDQHMPSLDVG